MKEKYLHILIAVWLLAASASTCLAAQNSFQALGDSHSEALGVSPHGSAVVGYSNKGPTDKKAFPWTAANAMQGIGYLPAGESYSSAYATSSNGSVIIGWSGSKAFRWVDLNGNGIVDLNEKLDNNADVALADFRGKLPASVAFDLSAHNSILARASYGPSNLEPFQWKDLNGNGRVDPGEQLDDNHAEFGLGDFPAAIFTSNARRVTPDRSVVVEIAGSDRGDEAFRRTDFNSNGLIGLNEKLNDHPELRPGRLPGRTDGSDVYDVSANAAVVVGWADSDSGHEAFRWQNLGKNSIVDNDEKRDNNPHFALADLPDEPFDSTANAVSADGSVVVGYGTADAGRRAVIRDPVNGMRDLQSALVDDWRLDLDGCTLLEAKGISADSLTIVGIGIKPHSYTEAWIASIPGATTLALLALGGFAFLKERSS